jgi:hypothetical protein
MLNLISKISSKKAVNLVHGAATLAKGLGCKVRQDRSGAPRYFIQHGADHYILSAREMLHRKVEKKSGDTYKQFHAGYLSFYKELKNTERNIWDVQQRDTEAA